MKTTACLFLLASALSTDFCVCATCKGWNLKIDDKTCAECARKASAFMH